MKFFIKSNTLKLFVPSKIRGVAAQIHEKSLPVDIPSLEKELDKKYSVQLFKGFINLIPEDIPYLLRKISKFSKLVINRLKKKTELKKLAIIDYCGANIGKPFHFGHIRSTILGDLIKKLYIANGIKALGDIHLGDNAYNFALTILGSEIKEETLLPMDLKKSRFLYSVGLEKAKQNPEFKIRAAELCKKLQDDIISKDTSSEYLEAFNQIRKLSVKYIKQNLKILNTKFEIWESESSCFNLCNKVVEEALDKKIAHEKDGAVYFKDFVIKRSNGTYLYATTDLATVYKRIFDLNADKIVYVVDKRQQDYFEFIFECCEKLGWIKNNQVKFVGFGAVLDKRGKPLKTRDKSFDNSDELIKNLLNLNIDDKACAGIIRSYDYQHNIFKDYKWDQEKACKTKGKTGVYILYSYARLCSIIEKRKLIEKRTVELGQEVKDKINELLAIMCQIKYCINSSIKTLVVGSVFNLLYEAANIFNQIYESDIRISELDDKYFDIIRTLKIFFKSLSKILGIRLLKKI